MENGKSLGVDGIPIEFYKEFLETIIPDLQKTFNETLFTNKKMPKTWNQAMITLIPKKGNIKLFKYWRPISLLCVDYKILTKILANRLRHILPQIISEEQNCSIPNRTIFNNLFLIRDMITYTKQKNNHLYLLQIDQEKALDKIDRNFLYKTLEKIRKLSKKTIYTKHINDNKQRISLTTRIIAERFKTRMSPFPTPQRDTRPSHNHKH